MASGNPVLDDSECPVAAEALRWVVRRMDRASWTAADEQALVAWRASKAEHDREFRRTELAADLLGQPQAHRDETGHLRKQANSAGRNSNRSKHPAISHPHLGDAVAYLEQARAAETDPESAIRLMDEAIIRLRRCDEVAGRLLLGRALIQRANLRRDRDLMGDAAAIFADYDEAEKHLLALLAMSHPAWREDLSELSNERGVAFLRLNNPASLIEAANCFDRVIEIASPLLAAGGIWDRCRLMAAWMNRGDALYHLNDPARLTEAVRCYDEAFTLVERDGVLEQPIFRRRYVVACINRAGILLARNAPGDARQATESAEAAISALESAGDESPTTNILLGAAWANSAAALSRLSPAEGSTRCLVARQAAMRSIQELERNDIRAAEAGINSRHALCVAAAKLVATPVAAATRQRFVSEALAAVNEGLALARHWEQRGVARFRWLATEMFTFGGRLSETYQPHLLGTFVLSHLDPQYTPEGITWRPELHRPAIALLEEAIQRLLNQRIAASANAQLSDYYLDSLNALCPAVARLRELDGTGGS